LIAMLGLLALLTLAVLLAMEVGLRRELSAGVAHEVNTASGAVNDGLQSSAQRLLAEGRVVAEEPRLKAVVRTPGVDRATLDDVTDELRAAVGWDVLLISDLSGNVLASSGTQAAAEIDLDDAAVASGAAGRQSVGTLRVGSRIYQAAFVPMVFGPEPIGIVVAAYQLGDGWADELSRHTHSVVALFESGHLVATAREVGPTTRDDATRWAGSGFPRVAELAGERFLATSLPLGDPRLRVGVFRSEDAALAPYRRMRSLVLGSSVLAALLAVVAAWFVAKGLARPVARIEHQSREIREAYAKLRELDTQIAEELEQARELQQRVMPSPPRIEAVDFEVVYRPATEVGGDVYDVLQLDSNRVRVFVADATGHGVAAALTTLWIKSEYDFVKRTAATPAQALGLLNARINLAHADTGVWFTALCLDVDLSKRRLSYAAAAHPGPLLAQNGHVEQLESGGPFIGLTPDASFPEWDAPFSPGDAVYAFSDGVIDQWDGAGRAFGETRLSDTIAAARQNGRPGGREVLSALETLAGPTGAFYDDVTFIGIEWRAQPAAEAFASRPQDERLPSA
jgi:serine phosphatase RsbU (regulator of sigma subunit)